MRIRQGYFDIGCIPSTMVCRDGRRICIFKGGKLVSVKLTWKWGGGRTCGSGHNGSDSFSTSAGFILNLCIMRYADFPPQSHHAANPEPKNGLIILFSKCPFHMKMMQKKRRVLELRGVLPMISTDLNLTCLRGQSVIRYIDTLSDSRDWPPGLNSALSFSIAWTIPA